MSKVFFSLFLTQFAFGFFFMTGHQDHNHEVNILDALPFLSSWGWFFAAMETTARR